MYPYLGSAIFAQGLPLTFDPTWLCILTKSGMTFQVTEDAKRLIKRTIAEYKRAWSSQPPDTGASIARLQVLYPELFED